MEEFFVLVCRIQVCAVV
uniref:Uncharacterized protein n=1 Tax=Arundo donax TaxID=35708 RepID=A0A0A9FMT6_ARUDO